MMVMIGVVAVPGLGMAAHPVSLSDAVFHRLDGSPVSLSDFSQSVVLLNFWGTWCVPCLQEIPELVRLSHQFHPQGLEVVGVAVESGNPDDIKTFMATHGMDYTSLIGALSLVKTQFHVIGFPTSLLIDGQGVIRKRYFGPQTFEVLKADVEPLLNTPGP